MTDYDSSSDTFYCADPSTSIPKARIKLTESALSKSYGHNTTNQDTLINYFQKYWYITNQSGGLETPSSPPGKPILSVDSSTLFSNCTTIFTWNHTERASYYQIMLLKEDGSASGYAFIEDNYFLVLLEPGSYTATLTATNSDSGMQTTSDAISFYVAAAEFVPVDTIAANGSIYALYDNSLTWYESKAVCESMGGHLVTITSAEEQAVIEKLLKSSENTVYYWMGATDEESEGTWTWITGEPFDYSNWEVSEPNNYQGIEHYGMIYRLNGKWNDYQNQGSVYPSFGFICEIPNQFQQGDVNLDGLLNTGDAVMILRYTIEAETLNHTQKTLADFNGDGKINTGDAVAVLKEIVS
ncbi:MAG: hypothetical protein GX802_01215 [Clostridiales bacterium]|nr:hypothetical protein [Clostridiales bacterium]